MRPILLSLLPFLVIFCSCYTEDDYIPTDIPQVFVDKPEKTILVDIIYVLPSTLHTNTYSLDEEHFINILNGSYFHRNGIGLVLGSSRFLYSEELYDLTDNRNEETSTFMQETQNSYLRDRLNIYIIKRSNTVAVSGLGREQRALITDEHLYNTTSAHEVGHALGLHHLSIQGNIMSTIRPYLRKEFNTDQIIALKDRIDKINTIN